MLSLSLAAQQGELALEVETEISSGVSALFGPSGCGKTTLLRAIAGLIPSRGRICFNGTVWQDSVSLIPSYERRIGYVFQGDRLFSHLTVEKNLRYGLIRAKAKGIPIQLTLDEVVAQFDLGHLLMRQPHSLSGGESRRVSMARAILSQPQLLLLDEPLTGLDSRRKAEIIPYLAHVTRELGIPTIYVSHINDEIARLCDSMLVMHEGRLIDQGLTGEVLPRLNQGSNEDRDSAEAGNLIESKVMGFDQTYSMIHLQVAGQPLQVIGSSPLKGQTAQLFFAARDVAIALRQPTDLSIRNTLAVTIENIEPLQGRDRGLVGIKMRISEAADINGQTPAGNLASPEKGARLTAHISSAACDALALKPNTKVYALIKSTRIAAPSDISN